MLPPFEEYCHLIATLPDKSPSIRSSTLTAYTTNDRRWAGKVTDRALIILEEYRERLEIG